MHLKYPRKRDHYSWEELRCLAKALGFRKDLFYRNIPKEIEKEKLTGLSVKLLSYLLDIKSLHGDVHRTYNMHDALYNSRVIEKAIDMLSNRYLSFQELREVRVAFQLYEHDDMLGLTIDDRTLLRTLKICGRTVSLVKLRQHIKHMPRQVSDRLLLFEFLDLLLLCERDSEVQLQQPLQITGVDKNNLYKLCDFQAVLSTEDQKKIHHLDNLYEQGSVRVFSEKQREFPSWRLQHHFLVDSNPRIELVSREQQRSVELCDHVNHSNKKVKHARCGFLGTSRKAAAFVDLNDVNKKLKPLTRYPVQLESLPLQHQKDETIKAEGTLDVFLEKGQEDQMVAAKVESASSGSQRFYRGFNGTTSDKLSRMSKAGRQRILVTPRDLHNSHMMTENLQWDIETQSQRLKQRMEKQMREKYADYYKRLQRLHESDSTPGNSCAENSMEGKMKNSPPVDTHLISEEDIPPMNFVVTPRKQVPKRDSIYKSLMSRLQRNNSLLVFGNVRVQDPGTSILRCASDDQLPRQRLHVKTLSSNRRENERTVDIRKLASMSSLRRKTDEEYGTREDEVEHLLERLQEANYIASGKRGMTLHNQFVFAR